MEAAGIEPASENPFTKLSPGAGCLFFSRPSDADTQASVRPAFLCVTASKAKGLFTSATYMMSIPHWGYTAWATGVSGTLRRTSCT